MWAWALGLLLVAAAALGLWWLRGSVPAGPAGPAGAMAGAASAAGMGAASARPAYVDNQSCIGCHQDAGKAWQQSHHFMAMAPPTEATVRGDFANATFKHQGVTSRFFRRDGKYFVNTDGPDGKMADFEIAWTFGVDPLQQYLIALPGGRLQPLTIAWDVQKKRWFHLYPHEKAPPGDVMHWTGRYQTANTMCIACHTTGYEKRYDAKTDTYATRWAEPNVSCQACHGPGSAHVAWAQSAASGAASAAPTAGPRHGLAVDLAKADNRAAVAVCAACHSRRAELTATPAAGEPLLDHYLPALLTPGLYHADGQQDGEVYAYGSFRQSKMYQHGVRCTDCHDAHTSKLKLPGNGVCLQCHQPTPNTRFPKAAGSFDTPAHHHHAPGSAGAQCVACHMPTKNYMTVHARPDHSLRIPRPDLDAATGAPDACTACHAGKPAPWAAAAIERWFGPDRRSAPHYGQAFAAARAGQPGAEAALAALAADTARPEVVRATALAALRDHPRADIGVRVNATRDADPEVRAAAADSLEYAPPPERLAALAPLLKDPLRAVRIAAARSLLTVPPDAFDASQRQAFDAALGEYIVAQNVSLDMPGARLNLAVVYASTGQPDLAEEHYLAALRIDPDFTPARANLAQFYAARARLPEAEQVLAEGVRRVPQQGELQYSLALVLAEQGKNDAAIAALRRAAALLPERARVRYNLGLALQHAGKRAEAQRAFAEAWKLDPRDPAIAYAMALLHAQDQRWAEALPWAERMLALDPGNPQAQQFVARLQAQSARAAGGAAPRPGG